MENIAVRSGPWLARIAWLLFAAAVLGTGPPLFPEPAIRPAARTASSRPNVLIFLTDDQRAGGTMQAMPKTVRWFGDGGVTFPNGFVTTPLCCPSRASIFSGTYAHNHGVRVNTDKTQVDQFDQRSTLQRYLKEAGYRTALIGKFLNDWTLSKPPPYIDRWATFAGGYQDPTFNVNGVVKKRIGYSTDILAEHGTSFLRGFEAIDARPWFLYVGTSAPHRPYQPEADYAKTPVGGWSGNPAVFESDRSDKPPPVLNYHFTYQDVDAVRIPQLRTLKSVDDLVDRTFRTLQQLGELGNTLAFFLSDNGYLWGEHGIGDAKRFPYRQSIGVPFLMRWNGHVPSGAIDTRLAANVDIVPTVLGAAGIEPDPGYPLDGISLIAPAKRARLLVEYWRSPDAPSIPSWASILRRGSQYVEWYRDDGSVSFREFYDLADDPWQLDNVLADGLPGNDPPVASLSAELAAARRCVGAACSPTTPRTLVADDFGTGSLSRWSSSSGLVVQRQEVFSPSWAARGTASGEATFARKTLGTTLREVYYRLRFKLIQQGPNHVAIQRLLQPDGDPILTVTVSTAGKLGYMADATGTSITSDSVVTKGIWHELQVRAFIDGATSATAVWLDGTKVGTLTRTLPLGTTPVGRVQMGGSATGRTYDVAFDDVVVSDAFVS
jgi:arylsulfatase A-like enzyme